MSFPKLLEVQRPIQLGQYVIDAGRRLEHIGSFQATAFYRVLGSSIKPEANCFPLTASVAASDLFVEIETE